MNNNDIVGLQYKLKHYEEKALYLIFISGFITVEGAHPTNQKVAGSRPDEVVKFYQFT
jgi:TATA-box binding protein (TBP) (component of TFIID and TFIIIB)